MKTYISKGLVLIAATIVLGYSVSAQEAGTNWFGLSARFGLNVTAKFKNLGRFSLSPSTRRTPTDPNNPRGSDTYNYDDGYVFKDISGDPDGLTGYWGYDDSSRQVSGNTILLSRNSGTGKFSSRSEDGDPTLGAELVYRRQLGMDRSLSYGVEAAINFMSVSITDHRPISGAIASVTDASYEGSRVKS